MGCDIHQRMFLYDNNSKGYVDVSMHYNQTTWEKCYKNSLGECFRDMEVVGDRHYDFFGVMGNDSRSTLFDPMDGLTEGQPDFFPILCPEDAKCPDWYGFSHCTIEELKKGFLKYIKRLEKGRKKNLSGYDDDMYMCDYLRGRLEVIETILNAMDTSEFKILCDINGYQIVPEKTTFVFWFDN